jgi:hypothetical protein
LFTASLSRRVKPAAVVLSTSVWDGRVNRGGWRRRAEKDKCWEPGRPARVGMSQRLGRKHKSLTALSGVGRIRSSLEAGNDRGAKGCDCSSAFIRARSSA